MPRGRRRSHFFGRRRRAKRSAGCAPIPVDATGQTGPDRQRRGAHLPSARLALSTCEVNYSPPDSPSAMLGSARRCWRAAIVQAVYDKSIDRDQVTSYLCATSHFCPRALTTCAPETVSPWVPAQQLRKRRSCGMHRPGVLRLCAGQRRDDFRPAAGGGGTDAVDQLRRHLGGVIAGWVRPGDGGTGAPAGACRLQLRWASIPDVLRLLRHVLAGLVQLPSTTWRKSEKWRTYMTLLDPDQWTCRNRAAQWRPVSRVPRAKRCAWGA